MGQKMETGGITKWADVIMEDSASHQRTRTWGSGSGRGHWDNEARGQLLLAGQAGVEEGIGYPAGRGVAARETQS